MNDRKQKLPIKVCLAYVASISVDYSSVENTFGNERN